MLQFVTLFAVHPVRHLHSNARTVNCSLSQTLYSSCLSPLPMAPHSLNASRNCKPGSCSVSHVTVHILTLRRLMSYVYGAPILDVSRSHTTTHHSRYDSSGRVISSSQRRLPDNTRHSQQTNTHAPGGIRTHDLSRRAAGPLICCDRGFESHRRHGYLSVVSVACCQVEVSATS